MTNEQEEWRAIPGYDECYEVSSMGRIRSLERTIVHPRSGPRKVPAKVLTPMIRTTRRGYLTVNLSKEGSRKTISVHRLVLLAFVGPCPEGMEGCHGNGDPADNRLSNLRWDTKKANAQDVKLHGTNFCASKTNCKVGHEFTPENTYITPRGSRDCRICRRDANRRRYARERGQNNAA